MAANWYGVDTYHRLQVLPQGFDLGAGKGVFILAKQSDSGWDAIYIGYGCLNDEFRHSDKYQVATEKGFTNVHFKYEPDELKGNALMKKLIIGNPECYEKHGGCNGD